MKSKECVSLSPYACQGLEVVKGYNRLASALASIVTSTLLGLTEVNQFLGSSIALAFILASKVSVGLSVALSKVGFCSRGLNYKVEAMAGVMWELPVSWETGTGEDS